MPSSYLVTGGAGFIGSSIVRALLARGDKVRVLDNFFSGKRENLAEVAGDIELIEGDIRDAATVARACAGRRGGVSRGGDPVGAAVAGRSDLQQRRQHRRHAERPARGQEGRRAARWSTRRRRPPTATRRRCPRSRRCARRRCRLTRVGKLAGEHYCQVFAGAYGLETVCLRYFNVFGAAPGSEVRVRRGHPALRDRGPGRPGRHHLRRRHPVARLLLHRQHRRGEPGRRVGAGRRRVGARVQRRLRRGDHAQRRGQAHRRGAGARRSRSRTRSGGWAT